MKIVLAPTMMHTWYEHGECSLNRSGVIALIICHDLEGQGQDLEDEGQTDRQNRQKG